MTERFSSALQNPEGERKRWLPGFASITNQFFNSDGAVTVIAKGKGISIDVHRLVSFRTDNFNCRLRTVRWNESLRQSYGDRVTLDWMQRFSSQEYQNGLLPRWGFITVWYANNNVSVLAEELPNAGMSDLENWNNGKPAMEIAALEYPEQVGDPFAKNAASYMSSKDVTRILLEAKDGKVDNLITGDMFADLVEGRNYFRKTVNSTLGIKIPVSPIQSISF